MAKPKIALYWCSSCGGCEESVIDLAEDILKVTAEAEIVFWPIAFDFKYKDLEALADGEIRLTLINGAIRIEGEERIAKLLRKKSQLIMAHGSCAHLGGVVGLANLYAGLDILNRAYKEAPGIKNPAGILPAVKTRDKNRELELPAFYDRVKALDQVIEVDYYIPGCPPTPELVKNAIISGLEDKLPAKGTVLADKKALCNTCSRIDSRPEKIKLKKFKRIHQAECKPDRCFLDQQIICLGPSTRGGCGERCIKANMPCRGCFGPLDNVIDQGAKSVSFLASLIDSDAEKELVKITDSIPDLIGLLYRYGLAASFLGGRVKRD